MLYPQASTSNAGDIRYLYHNALVSAPASAPNPFDRNTCALSFDDQGDSSNSVGDTSSTDSGDTSSTETSSTDSGDTGSDSGITDSGSADSGNTGNTDTGNTDSGNTDTGNTDSGNTDTGSTGSSDTGNTDNTDTGNTGSADTGSSDSGDTGSSDSGDTGNQGGSGDSGNAPSGSGSGSGMGSGTQADPWIIDNFAIDSATMPTTTTGGQSVSDILSAVAAAVRGRSNVTIHVIGFTDTSGAMDHNQTLSQQRADAAKQALSVSAIVSIATEGQGATNPRSPHSADDDAAGHNARNRRVEIWYEADSSSDSSTQGCNVHYDVQLTAQPNKTSCWAGSMAMLISYRRQASINPDTLATEVGRDLRTSYSWDMLESVRDHFGFQTISQPSNVSVYIDPKQWCAWLTQYGPLWVTTVGDPSHAIIVAGMTGDGTAAGSTVYILNPWDTTAAFSADPIDFSPVNMGRSYNQSFDQFSADYGNLGLSNYGEWRILYLPR